MGRMNILLVMTLVAIGFSVAQAETLYKWVDKNGRVSYRDQPPPENAGYRVEEKKLRGRENAEPDKNQDVVAKFPVVLYTVPKCASCDLARAYLDKRKVPYAEKNVESDLKLQEELKERTGSLSVPTITIGDKIMKGYLESLLEGELNEAGYSKNEAAEKMEKEAK